MAGNRSFINYISDRFYNDFCSYIERHIEENQDKLDLKIQNVHDVGEINLTDMEVKNASINDLPGMEIEFDVAVEAIIEVSERDYHYDDYDLCNQWFLLNCKGNLENSLDDFEEGTVYGKLENVEGRRITVKVDRDLTDTEIGKKTEVFVVAQELVGPLKEFVGSDLRFHAKEYDDEYQASNIEVKIGDKYYYVSKLPAANKALEDAIAKVENVELKVGTEKITATLVKEAVEKQINDKNVTVKVELTNVDETAKTAKAVVTLSHADTNKTETKQKQLTLQLLNNLA